MNSKKQTFCTYLIDSKFSQMQNHLKNLKKQSIANFYEQKKSASCVRIFSLLIEGNFVFRRQISKKFNFMHILSRVKLMQPISYRQMMSLPITHHNGLTSRPRVIRSQSYHTLFLRFFFIFAFKLGHFKVQTLFSYTTNTQA
jgi:hypothetical protein